MVAKWDRPGHGQQQSCRWSAGASAGAMAGAAASPIHLNPDNSFPSPSVRLSDCIVRHQHMRRRPGGCSHCHLPARFFSWFSSLFFFASHSRSLLPRSVCPARALPGSQHSHHSVPARACPWLQPQDEGSLPPPPKGPRFAPSHMPPHTEKKKTDKKKNNDLTNSVAFFEVIRLIISRLHDFTSFRTLSWV